MADSNSALLYVTVTPVIALLALSPFYFVVYTTYNIFLHPLRHIPGPRLWAANRLLWCWYQYNGTLHNRLLDLHIKYGHVVRIAPNEISFTSDTAWKTIYGHRSPEMGKDPVFSLHTPTGAQNILVADRETHVRQRRLLSHAFSEKALREQENILQLYIDKLLRQLSMRSSSGPLNMVAWYNFTSNAAFDLIGDMSFGENFGCLDIGDYVPFVGAIKAMATELTFTQMWKYWGLMGLRQYFMPKHVAGKRVEHMKWAMARVQRRVQLETDRKDFLHYILAANDDKGMSPAEINVNAFSLNIAGSESTATLLSGATFFILSHPQVYARLVGEIRGKYMSEQEITLANSYNLEYLEAVLSETLRLYPPVAITLPRVVPAGGETIDGYTVPEGTTVGVHHFSCYHHPRNFYRPNNFLPERWLPGVCDAAPFDQDNRACMQAFSFGPRNCLGKNLAKAELRLIIARLLFRFDLELAEPQTDWQSRQTVHGFWEKGPLMCRLSPVARDIVTKTP